MVVTRSPVFRGIRSPFSGVDMNDPSLALYAPLWHPGLSMSPFLTRDLNHHVCTVVGAIYGSKGRTLDGDDWITIPDSPILSFGDGVNDVPFTMWGWINLSDFGSAHVIFSKLDNATTLAEYELIYSGNMLYFEIINGVDGGKIGRGAPFTSANYLNKWVHYALTYDASKASSGIKIYLNAVQSDNVDDQSGTYGASKNTAAAFYIGRRVTDDQLPFKGIESELRVHRNKVLSNAEITDNYNATKGRYPL